MTFKNCAPFTKCITKIDGTTKDDAEEKNYSDIVGNLWFFSKNEVTDFDADIVNNNNFKSFENNTKLLEYTVVQPALNQANGILKNVTISVPLKSLSNFWMMMLMLIMLFLL